MKILWKVKPIRDPEYLEFIRSQPCIVCQSYPPSEPHHLQAKGHGGRGRKTDDIRTLPLCHKHHYEMHFCGRETFATKYGVDYERVLLRLNLIYGVEHEPSN